jgi:hypothetical protein
MTDLEQYGATYGMEDPIYSALVTGFDNVRTYAGWESFCIPEYVWTWVTQAQRDRILTLLYESLWTTREGNIVEIEAHFAWFYAVCLMQEYWRAIGDDDRPLNTVFYATWVNNWGIPSDAISGFTVEDGYQIEWGDIILPASGSYYIDGPNFRIYTNDTYSWVNLETDGTDIEYFVDTDEANYNYFEDNATGGTYDELAEVPPTGVVASWPRLLLTTPDGTYANSQAILSGSMTFKTFGLASGSVSLTTALTVGDTVTVEKYVDDVATTLFTGIAMDITQSLADGVYSVSIGDPVTADGGEVSFESGNAITVLQSIIEDCGGTFETELTTEEEIFSTGDDVTFQTLAKTICYAIGATLQYGKDGVYRLISSGTAHTITDALVVADDSPTITEDPDTYYNQVLATVDQEWTEDVEVDETETVTGYGFTITTTKRGERIAEIVTADTTEGTTTTETYTYDVDNYLISKVVSKLVVEATRDTTTTTWTRGEDDDHYTYSNVVSQEQWWPTLSDQVVTYDYEEMTREECSWDVDLTGVSSYSDITSTKEDRIKPTYAPDDDQGHTYQLMESTKATGFVVGGDTELSGHSRTENFRGVWVLTGFDATGMAIYEWGWTSNGSSVDDASDIPSLEIYLPETTQSVSLTATAEDEDSIETLGEITKEVSVSNIKTETALDAYALALLAEYARICTATATIVAQGVLPHDTVTWRNAEWVAKSVCVDLSDGTEKVTLKTTSSLERLQSSRRTESTSDATAIMNAINGKTSLYHNVCRGKVLGNVKVDVYSVKVEGSVYPIHAKAYECKPIAIGTVVLLVRPTGVGGYWTILVPKLKKAGMVSFDSVQSKETPDTPSGNYDVTSFVASVDSALYHDEITFTWVATPPTGRSLTGFSVVWGDGTTETFTAETFTTTHTYIDETLESVMPTIQMSWTTDNDDATSSPHDLDNGPIALTLAPAFPGEDGKIADVDFVLEPGWDTGVIESATELSMTITDVEDEPDYPGRGNVNQGMNLKFTIEGEATDDAYWAFRINMPRRTRKDGTTVDPFTLRKHEIRIGHFKDLADAYGYNLMYAKIVDTHYFTNSDNNDFSVAFETVHNYVFPIPGASVSDGIVTLPSTEIEVSYLPDYNDTTGAMIRPDGYTLYADGTKLIAVNDVTEFLPFPKTVIGTNPQYSREWYWSVYGKTLEPASENTVNTWYRPFRSIAGETVKSDDDTGNGFSVSNLRFRLLEYWVPDCFKSNPWQFS